MAAVGDFNANDDVIEVLLGVFHLHIEVAAVIEHAGVRNLVFGIVASARAIFVDETFIRKSGLRIL